MTKTEEYILKLTNLKTGELGLLRTHSGQQLDESVEGFDLFSGLWWPLRQESQHAPRREVAWLIAKLYAFSPMTHSHEALLAHKLASFQPKEERAKKRFRQKFDDMLLTPLSKIEPMLQWALTEIASASNKLDWVKLTDDLSAWERERTRWEWALQFLGTEEREEQC